MATVLYYTVVLVLHYIFSVHVSEIRGCVFLMLLRQTFLHKKTSTTRRCTVVIRVVEVGCTYLHYKVRGRKYFLKYWPVRKMKKRGSCCSEPIIIILMNCTFLSNISTKNWRTYPAQKKNDCNTVIII